MSQNAPRSLYRTLVRKFFHLTFLLRRPMTMGVRAVVLDRNRSVFLVRHGYVPGWHFPGGGVDPGERCVEAMARELREEAHIEVTGPVQLHGLYFNREASRRDHVAVYVVREFQVGLPRDPDWEIAESGFFPVDALPEGVTRGTRERLAEILVGIPAAAEW